MRNTQFGPLKIEFGDGVLPPREWTLLQSEWAIELARDAPPGPVLELCGGAGHIGLVAAYGSGRPLVQVESDPVAGRYAERNAAKTGVSYELRCADLATAVADSERFPIILADPPYLPSDEVRSFPDDPPTAIDGGPDGLDVTRACLAVAERALTTELAPPRRRSVRDLVARGDQITHRTSLLLQVRGATQAKQVEQLLRERDGGLRVIEVRSVDEDRGVALIQRWD